ncbi:MAG TPA: hypothetical protein PLT38_03485 [Rubrivivax sp.]|jgi:hypothetical protein|nr:hypothetical protein [Rubrivivax sp.]
MPRCAKARRAAVRGLAAALLLPLATLPAAAQMRRNFPANALRGELVFTQPPAVLLNDEPAQLAPGARLRGENNMLLVHSALAGQRLVVHYTRDLTGSLLDVWVLTPAERAKKPWPATPAQAAAWAFDPLAQTWSKP